MIKSNSKCIRKLSSIYKIIYPITQFDCVDDIINWHEFPNWKPNGIKILQDALKSKIKS